MRESLNSPTGLVALERGPPCRRARRRCAFRWPRRRRSWRRRSSDIRSQRRNPGHGRDESVTRLQKDRSTRASKRSFGAPAIGQHEEMVLNAVFDPAIARRTRCAIPRRVRSRGKVRGVKRSSVMRGFALAFRQPSSMVQASPGGFFWRGSSQSFMRLAVEEQDPARRASLAARQS